jgi:cobalt/nickel transport system ATP-binding protein
VDVIPIATQVAVRIVDLSYSYPDGHRALNSVNLIVHRGENLGILGPNGAGKSTLALHLNGILSGQGLVEIMGLEVKKKNFKEVRNMVGLVFQDPDDQLFSPTVKEDVAFGPLNQRLSPEQVEHALSQALAWVGMEGFEDRSPFHLSFGEKKRVSLATVLSMDPEIMVLDEPVSNMDPRGRREFIKLIQTLKATKILVTHDLALAREACARVVIMDDGEIIADGPTEVILSDERLLERHGLL